MKSADSVIILIQKLDFDFEVLTTIHVVISRVYQ